MLGSLLALVASGLLIYRALYFASQTENLSSAIVGVLLGAISLVLTFKALGEAGENAENNVQQIRLGKLLGSVVISFVGSLVAIHFAGLSVVDYLQWIIDGIPV